MTDEKKIFFLPELSTFFYTPLINKKALNKRFFPQKTFSGTNFGLK